MLARLLAACVMLVGVAHAGSDQCCYYDCHSAAGGIVGVPNGRGGMMAAPTGPFLRAILTTCETTRSCPSEAPRVLDAACFPLAFRVKDVRCADANSCLQGVFEGRRGEALLVHLLEEPHVVFVRKTTYELRSGRIVKIRPSKAAVR
jgi:hypothetical protein